MSESNPDAPPIESAPAPGPAEPAKRRVQIGVAPTPPVPKVDPAALGRRPDPRRPADPIDEAMQEAVRRVPARPDPPRSLKKHWDEDLEAELQAAMGDMDDAALRNAAINRSQETNRPETSTAGRGGRLGKVVAIRGGDIFVDLGGKSEGLLPAEQFDQLQRPQPLVGEMLEVIIDRFDSSAGVIKLALKGAAIEVDWTTLRKGVVVEARVTKVNKGGLDVDVDGIRGFLPISQIDLNRVEDATPYLNEKLRVLVTEANERLQNLVVSRKDLLIKEREEQAVKTWEEIAEGQVRKGTVRSIKDYGAFVDVGGVDGLLHVADLSWGKVKDVAALLVSGQEVEVKILKVDREAKKLSLGLKQLTPSPWELAAETYPSGKIVRGKVTKLMEFGAFVELEPGIEGLIHISELGDARVRRVSDVVKPGQEVEVRILKFDREIRKVALSIKQAKVEPEADPADDEGEDDTPPAPKPERKIPLKGGLGGGGSLFGLPGGAGDDSTNSSP